MGARVYGLRTKDGQDTNSAGLIQGKLAGAAGQALNITDVMPGSIILVVNSEDEGKFVKTVVGGKVYLARHENLLD
jgi:hypothetical protein